MRTCGRKAATPTPLSRNHWIALSTLTTHTDTGHKAKPCVSLPIDSSCDQGLSVGRGWWYLTARMRAETPASTCLTESCMPTLAASITTWIAPPCAATTQHTRVRSRHRGYGGGSAVRQVTSNSQIGKLAAARLRVESCLVNG